MISTDVVCLLSLVSLAYAMPRGLEDHNSGNGYGMIGGQSANIKDYPYTAAIYTDYLQSLVGSGAIVGKQWIVCAAYQIIGYSPEILTVRVGSNNAAKGGQLVNVTKMIFHNEFSMDYPNDIALLNIATPLKLGKTVKVIKLANKTPTAGTEAQVTGFGKTEDDSANQLDLKVAKVNVLSQDDCRKEHPSLDDTSFCADSDGVGPCESDIGSPLVNNNQLIGLYVGGDTCNHYGVPEIYTNVAVLAQWVKDTIKNNSNVEEIEGFAEDDDSE